MIYSGWRVLPLFVLFSLCCCIPDGDLCRWMNGRKYYIDVGESGLINAENVSSQVPLTHPMGLKVPLSGNGSTQLQIPQRCSVELITCPSCHFRVTVIRMNIPTCSVDKSCRCDFVWIKEAAYSKSGQEFCGQISANGTTSSISFESNTKLVSVDFLYTGSYTDAFSLQFSAIKNVYVYKGGYDHYPSNSTGIITSPNFPGGYPSDYSAEYVLQNVDNTGYVQLLFTDFQLSLWSYMEILDSNGSRIDVYNGNTFRPPALISSGPIMTVKFQANEEYPSSGFRAIYTFVNYAEKYWINRPSTDCGGFVEDYGGAITMMNMVPGNVMRAFDCIWLIRPQNAGVPGTQISVRVAQFEEMGPKSTLTIRKGLYSESSIVESITPFQQHKLRRGQEYVEQASIGFYIRLIGQFNNRSHLAIIYSTFRYEGCYAVGDLECENGRCIKNALRCDGFNHCSDGSDEASCYGTNQGTPSPEDANWWRTLTPNYYFPKSDSNPSAGTNTLILVTSLAGLGMFVLTTIVILVKLHKQRKDDGISREILQTISADIEADNSQYNQVPPSDPPMYDPPPTYEDVIKYYLPPPPAYSSINQAQNNSSRAPQISHDGADNQGPNTRGRGRRFRPSKHRSPAFSEEPPILRVALPSEGENHRNSRTNEATTKGVGVPSATGVLPLYTAAVHSSRTTNNTISKSSNTQSSPINANHVKNAAPCKPPLIKTVKKCHFLRTTSDSLSCDCDGACSCVSAKQKSSGAIRIDGNDARTKRPSLLGSSLCAENGPRFKDALKTVNNNRALKSPIVSSSQKVIVMPSRSKSFVNEDQSSKKVMSKSAGPLSPNDRHVSPCQPMHRRSSSGPSEILTHQQSTDSNATDTTDSSLSQMKNLSTTIVSVSSGPPSTEIAPENHVGPKTDKNILPLGWGALWNPVKRRPDVPLTPNTDVCSWQQNDKQPLLRQTTQDLKATPYQGSVGSPT